MTPVHPDTLAALTAGIQSEVAAYVFYLEAIKKVNDNNIKETLKRLAGEEKTHFQILERQFDSLVRSEKWISTADLLKHEGLPEIGEEMTAAHKELIMQVQKMGNNRDILDMAYRLEVQSRDLFKGTASKATAKEARDIFEQLARFEEGHMNIIKKMIAQL
jgi:rubrerythrin